MFVWGFILALFSSAVVLFPEFYDESPLHLSGINLCYIKHFTQNNYMHSIVKLMFIFTSGKTSFHIPSGKTTDYFPSGKLIIIPVSHQVKVMYE
jgi:hypothetical protein